MHNVPYQIGPSSFPTLNPNPLLRSDPDQATTLPKINPASTSTLDLVTPADGDYSGSSSKTAPVSAPMEKFKSKSKKDENNNWTRPTSCKRKKNAMSQPTATQPWPGAAGIEDCVDLE